jgi:hypothetical protein
VKYRLSAFADQLYKSDVIPGLWDEVSDYVIVRCTGTVTGSVDMEKVTIHVVDAAEGRRVSIHFERGSVTISGVNTDQKEGGELEVISCREKLKIKGAFHSASSAQRKRLEELTKEKIYKAAIDTGIVTKTMENAKSILNNFVGAFGYQAIVTFDENAYAPPPPKK